MSSPAAAGCLCVGHDDKALGTRGLGLGASRSLRCLVVRGTDGFEEGERRRQAAEARPRAIEGGDKLSRQVAVVAQAFRPAWIRRVRFQS